MKKTVYAIGYSYRKLADGEPKKAFERINGKLQLVEDDLRSTSGKFEGETEAEAIENLKKHLDTVLDDYGKPGYDSLRIEYTAREIMTDEHEPSELETILGMVFPEYIPDGEKKVYN